MVSVAVSHMCACMGVCVCEPCAAVTRMFGCACVCVRVCVCVCVCR